MTSSSSQGDVTRLLEAWQAGDAHAADALFRRVYGELRKMAGRYIAREYRQHTITPTGLVHHACLNLLDQEDLGAQNRAHFYAIVATQMRRFLVDYARRHNAAKRNHGQAAVPWEDELLVISQDRADEILALDEALARLADDDPLQSQIVELRYFGGYTQQEIADMLDLSLKKVRREWYLAKAWLRQVLEAE